MRWLWGAALLAATSGLRAQGLPVSFALPNAVMADSSSSVTDLAAPDLPDDPGYMQPQVVPPATTTPVKTCVVASPKNASAAGPTDPGCAPPEPYKYFVSAPRAVPMTPEQKGKLAFRAFRDPFNAVTIVGNSIYTIASDSHTAYGPGLQGFGKLVGYSYSQDATGTFFGVFAIPVLVHEDPRYHRMPHHRVVRRLVHAVSRTIIAENDNGHPMPNWATLLNYPICAEIGNLYVPGVATNGPSTTLRVLEGYETDPIGNIIAEFLPDVASRIHIQVLFVQRLLNQVAAPANSGTIP